MVKRKSGQTTPAFRHPSLTKEGSLEKTALVPEAEQPYPLPENWMWTRLNSVAFVNPPKKSFAELDLEEDVTFVPMAAVDDVSGAITSAQQRPLMEVKTGYTQFIEGDVIFAKITPCMENGKAAIVKETVNGIAYGSTEFYVLRPCGINVSLLYFFVRAQSFRNGAKHVMSGAVGQQRVPKTWLEQHPIPLPPLQEQQRIAEKLESLLGKIKEAKALLDEIPEILQSFRQTVLAAACSGRLTADWRRENPEKKSSLVNSRQNRKSHLFEMPTTWAMVTVKDMSTSIEYGYTASANKLPVGPKLLRITDIQDGTVNWEDVPYCEIDEKRKRKFLLAPGDIVFARTGATTGKSFLIEACPAAVFASYLIRIKSGSEMIPKFMYFFFQSDFYWQQISENLSGIAQPNCNATKLSSVNIPLPPFSEQDEIVRNIKSLFSKADDLEAQYKEAMGLVESLSEIILFKAFRGKLVPQDPHDEPAIKSLKRITDEVAQ